MAKPNYSFEKRQKEIAKKKKKEEKRLSKLAKNTEEDQAPLVDGEITDDADADTATNISTEPSADANTETKD